MHALVKQNFIENDFVVMFQILQKLFNEYFLCQDEYFFVDYCISSV